MFNWQNVAPEGIGNTQATRALTNATVGAVLVQQVIDRTIQDVSVRYRGAQAALTRKTGTPGATHAINRRAPGTTGAEWLLDTDSITDENGTYTQALFPYRILGTKVRVTRFQQATGANYIDTMVTELTQKANDFAQALETAIIKGDTSVNSKQFNGLLTLTNAVSGQVVANSSAVDALQLTKLDATIDAVRPGNRALITSLGGARALNRALQVQQRFTNETMPVAGFRVPIYDDCPVFKSTEVPDVLNCNSSGALLTYSGGTSTAIICVNTDEVFISELNPLTAVALPMVTSQYNEVEMYWYGTLVHANTKGSAMLTNLAPAS